MALRLEVRTFLEDCIKAGDFIPQSDSWQSSIDIDFSKRLAKRGWLGMNIPTEYGGQGKGALERFVVTEELLAYGAPVAAHWIADRQMGATILRNGTEEQRRTYLPGIASGERYFCIGMSEPDSGSDLASVRTKATPDGTGWRIKGEKVWTSIAHVATNMVALVRTDEGERQQGLSQFLIDLPHPQITITPTYTIDGEHHFNQVYFDNAYVEGSALLGARGDGWRQVTAELATERSGPERLLSVFPLLEQWASTIEKESPFDDLELGRLLGRLIILRQMSLGVVSQLIEGSEPAIEAALVKYLGTVFEGEVVDTVRRSTMTMPGLGTSQIEDLLADSIKHSPAFTLRGGTIEILCGIIAKGLWHA